ncbi:MAG: DUF2521 family protein [Bacillus sp. (in: Bacteria)]|jgi:hypothetical protein|nr:DUF2521 family protein [Bacillus sp. (in: firmicutes)]
MAVIKTFSYKKREKELHHERMILRELSISMLRDRMQKYFRPFYFECGRRLAPQLEEGCYDMAIEAYLLGAKYSRFGYYGESVTQVRHRCRRELKDIIDTLYNDWLYWGIRDHESLASESIYYACEQYIDSWWTEGFLKATRRRKLRLK